MKFISAYDKHDALSFSSGLACDDPSLTQQQFKEESDINNIVDRFMKTGHLPLKRNSTLFGSQLLLIQKRSRSGKLLGSSN